MFRFFWWQENNTYRRYFEVIVQLFIAYSLISYFLEIELIGSERSTGFWLWSERIVAAFFTVEYLIRWINSDNRLRYPFRLMAVIDFLAIVPFYVGFFVDLRALRMVRALRVLRVFKLYRYNSALDRIVTGFRNVRDELIILSFAVLIMTIFSSVLMYEFEHKTNPSFNKLSDSIWWCVVTLTTVGYGDAYPVTWPGKIVAMITMLSGIGVVGSLVGLIANSLVTKVENNEHTGKNMPSEAEKDESDRSKVSGSVEF